MRCVDTTLDVLEGWTIVALLRANGIDAHLFNENFVRQNWFEVIGYGGFRITVNDESATDARELVAAYRRGDLAVANEAGDFPPCPHCQQDSTEGDPTRRRWPFVAYMGLVVLLMMDGLFEFLPSPLYLFLLFAPGLLMMMPMLLRRIINHRFRCRACGFAWHDRTSPGFGLAQRNVENALAPPA